MRLLLIVFCLLFSLAANAGGGGSKSTPSAPPAPKPPPEPQAPKQAEGAYSTARDRVRRRAKNDTQVTDGNADLGPSDISKNVLGGSTTLGG